MPQPVPEIIYAFDPLCGWCYGFSPVVARLRSTFGHHATWRLMSGGLVTGDRMQPIREMKDYLQHGMAAVTARTGQQFGEGFLRLLDEGSWISRSEPACRAMFVVQREWPAAAMDFAQALCAAFYQTGLKLDAPDTLAIVAESCGLDAKALLELWSGKTAQRETAAEFANASRLGITGYPALHLSTGAGIKCLVNGCASFEQAYASLRNHIPHPIDAGTSLPEEFAQ